MHCTIQRHALVSYVRCLGATSRGSAASDEQMVMSVISHCADIFSVDCHRPTAMFVGIADNRVMTRHDNSSGNATVRLHFDQPAIRDGKAIHELIRRCPPLDLNSSYSYFLLCAHHTETCVAAWHADRLAGFISAYRLPRDEQILFIWQVAVESSMRGLGLAGRMLDELLERPSCTGVRFIETTVSPSNHASRQVFTRFAERHRAPLHEEVFLSSEQFGAETHEEEVLLRIGPFHI